MIVVRGPIAAQVQAIIESHPDKFLQKCDRDFRFWSGKYYLITNKAYCPSFLCRSSRGVFPNSAPKAVEKCEPDENPHISPTCTIE